MSRCSRATPCTTSPPVERPVGLHEKQARLGEQRRLLDAHGRRSPPAKNIEVPLAGFFDADTVAHGEIRQAHFSFASAARSLESVLVTTASRGVLKAL
jgi:hypothetical protein